jgi:large-conductance mechanosensitive channel
MTNNTITFIFIHVLQLLVLLIGTGFNKVVTTFANNILEDSILHTVLHVPNAAVHVSLKLPTQLGNFELRCRVFGSIQWLTRLLVLFLYAIVIITIIVACELL